MKILVAEDNAFFRRLIITHLAQWGHEVIGCEDGTRAWDLLQSDDAPPLAVLDWDMPGLEGIQICRRLRAQSDRPYTYVILLTGKTAQADLVKGLESGADDYVTKPFDPLELRMRIRAATRILELQENLLAAFRSAEQKAKEDPLTGLWNHSAVLSMLRIELDRSNRQGSPLAVIMVDVDRFKQINDSFGHLVGDAVIVQVARTLRAEVRSYDSVGRYGGDEFLVVLPGCTEPEAEKLAHRLVATISRKCGNLGHPALRVSVSMGVAVSPRFAEEAETLVRAADQALYLAKRDGRGKAVLGTAAPEVHPVSPFDEGQF